MIRAIIFLSAAALFSGCQTPKERLATAVPSPLPISKNDHTTQWWGDPWNYGPRQHYTHVVRDKNGKLKDVYRYYFNSKGEPVLNGPRVTYRSENDPGHTILYKDGKIIRESDNIVN